MIILRAGLTAEVDHSTSPNVVIFGLDDDYRPMCLTLNSANIQSINHILEEKRRLREEEKKKV